MDFLLSLYHWLIRITLDITVLLVMFTLLPGIPPNVTYTSYELEKALPLEGPLARNNEVDAADRIMDGKIVGPESIASRNPEEIFVSLHGGKILRVWGPKFDHFKIITSIGPGCDGPWQERVCGRPLGLRFAPDGHLLVADAYLGLFAVDVDTGEHEKLFDISQEINGTVPKIPDDLDIDSEGNIYWSDASTVSTLENGMIEFLSDPSGRLIKFDPKTKANTVLVKNVHFTNGVQLSPDHDFVLFCECFRSRVMRYWLKGAKAGQTDVFVDRLPGLPDNIRSKVDGGYYVSLVSVNSDFDRNVMGILAKLPLVRKFILRILTVTKMLFEFFNKIYPTPEIENIAYRILQLEPIARRKLLNSNLTIVVELDADGNIIDSLQGDSGKIVLISETKRVGDYLFFGSPYNKYLGCLFVGSPGVEVEGKGVRMKTEKELNENEAGGVEDREAQLEKQGNLIKEETFENVEEERVVEKTQSKAVEPVEEKVKENITEEKEKLVKEEVEKAAQKKETEDVREQERLKHQVEHGAKEDVEVQSKENQFESTESKKKVEKEEL